MKSNCQPARDENLIAMLNALTATARREIPVQNDAKPVVGWQGGKRWLVKELLAVMPKHKRYIELFCGGGALLCGKEPSKRTLLS